MTVSVQNFWQTLPKDRPFFALAPLEDVTDVAFRRHIAAYGAPDVCFTEFTSADGLVYADEKGKKKLMRKLAFSESERPIAAQLFTSVPEHMERGAALVRELGFDGIDINMGCPDRAVEKQGCGAALMKDPAKARELIRAAKSAGLPVSVKTRIGYAENELDTWLPELLAEEPAAVTIHARTRRDLSDVPAKWDAVAQAVSIRDAFGSGALILGNGDVQDLNDAREKAAKSRADGVMLGRAIFGNPWLFADRADHPSKEEKINALIEHIALFDELLNDVTSFAVMKKHFKAYVQGWDGAKELRVRLMDTATPVEATALLEACFQKESVL